MTARLDIFRTENGGEIMWIGSAETLDQARARIREIQTQAPAEYFVFHHDTKQKTVFRMPSPRLSGSAND